jgi:hypothetical protein
MGRDGIRDMVEIGTGETTGIKYRISWDIQGKTSSNPHVAEAPL